MKSKKLTPQQKKALELYYKDKHYMILDEDVERIVKQFDNMLSKLSKVLEDANKLYEKNKLKTKNNAKT